MRGLAGITAYGAFEPGGLAPRGGIGSIGGSGAQPTSNTSKATKLLSVPQHRPNDMEAF